MGANPMQASGVLLFLLAFVMIAAGVAAGARLALMFAGAALLAVSAVVLAKAKPREEKEEA